MSKSINNLNLTDVVSLLDDATHQKPVLKKEGAGLRARSSSHVVTKIDSQLAFVNKKAREAADRQREQVDSRMLQAVLPLWDDESRGVPNPFIRSGLFSVRNTEKRDWLENLHIESLKNYDISYTGKELQQEDLSVWMALIHLAKDQPMSDAVFFTGYQLIKDLGWSMNTKSYKRAQESISRLKVTGIVINTANQDEGYSGSLIREFRWKKIGESGDTKWMVRFEPQVSAMFMHDTTTLLEWETRKKIGGRSTVAQWLHGFYSSHQEPFAYGVPKLHELSRSGDTLSSFRSTIKRALQKLQDVGFLSKWAIVNDQVHVTRALRPKLIRSS
jgi:hypothetical protein